AQKQSAASSSSHSSPRHSSREGAVTKAHPRQASGLVKKSTAAPLHCCLTKNGKDGSTGLRRAQKSFAMCETTSRNLRPKAIACITMRWPLFLADTRYRNPSVWTWREWLTVVALGIATTTIVAILLWPIAKLLIGP